MRKGFISDELFSLIKNLKLKTKIEEYSELHKLSYSLWLSSSLDEGCDIYERTLKELKNKFNLFRRFPKNFSTEIQSMFCDIRKFNDVDFFIPLYQFPKLRSSDLIIGDSNISSISSVVNDPFSELNKYINTLKIEKLTKQKAIEAGTREDLFNNLSAIELADLAYDERLGGIVRQESENNYDLSLDEQPEMQAITEKTNNQKLSKNKSAPKTHRICIISMSFMHKEKLLDITKSTTAEIWQKIIDICTEVSTIDSKKLEEEKKWHSCRNQITTNLDLTELIILRDSKSGYYFGYKDAEKIKNTNRTQNQYIEFKFTTFKNNFSHLKAESLAIN